MQRKNMCMQWHKAERYGETSASEYRDLFTRGTLRDVRHSLYET